MANNGPHYIFLPVLNAGGYTLKNDKTLDTSPKATILHILYSSVLNLVFLRIVSVNGLNTVAK